MKKIVLLTLALTLTIASVGIGYASNIAKEAKEHGKCESFKCSKCNGTGWDGQIKCWICKGTGANGSY